VALDLLKVQAYRLLQVDPLDRVYLGLEVVEVVGVEEEEVAVVEEEDKVRGRPME